MKKHAHLLAILAVLLLCIGSVLWTEFGPKDSGGGCSGIEAHHSHLLQEKAAYEVIEAYLRQKFDAGTIPAGKTIYMNNLAYPEKTSPGVFQQFYIEGIPENVQTAINALSNYHLTGYPKQRRSYSLQMTLFPEFTLVEPIPGHCHDYILFTAEGEPDKAAFLAAYPQYSDVTFTPVEGRWYITETIFAPLEEPEFRWEDYKGQLGIQWVIP